MTVVAGCRSPKSGIHATRTPHPKKEKRKVAGTVTEIPSYVQGAIPEFEITATGWRGTLDAQGMEAAREVLFRIDGPESVAVSRFLMVPPGRDCSPEMICTYYSPPFGTQTIDLGRRMKVGRYSVTATSPVGVKLDLKPSSFEITSDTTIRVAKLQRDALESGRPLGSVAVAHTPTGLVVANSDGNALYLSGHTKNRVHTIEGGNADIATSIHGIAVAYTADNEPRLSLLDSEFAQETAVSLGPKYSYQQRGQGEAPVQVSWNSNQREWLAVWIRKEPITKAQARAARFARRWSPVPDRISVARFAHISSAGKARPSEKIAPAEVVSNLVWNGKEHALLTASQQGSQALGNATWRTTLVQIRRGRVVRRTHFDHKPKCDQLTQLTLRLAWNGKDYVAAIQDDAGPSSRGTTLSETTRLSLVRFGKGDPIELIVDAKRNLSSVQIGFLNEKLWLVYASTEKKNQRAQVVAALIGQNLRAEKVIVLDDGYDAVRKVVLYPADGILKTAIFRDEGASVVVLPNELGGLPVVRSDTLLKKTACLPNPELERTRGGRRRTPQRPQSFRLRIRTDGPRNNFEIRKGFVKRHSDYCLQRLPDKIPALIEADFVVSPKGQVLGASVQRGTLSEDVHKCLLGSLKAASYPADKKLTTRVHIQWRH